MTKVIDRVNPNSGIQLKDITIISTLCNKGKSNSIDLVFNKITNNAISDDLEILTYDYFNNGEVIIALLLEHTLIGDFLYTATINWNTVTPIKSRPAFIEDCKLKDITPEQSAKIQEIAFTYKCKWNGDGIGIVQQLDDTCLFIEDSIITSNPDYSDTGHNEISNKRDFDNTNTTELTYDQFIAKYDTLS